MESKLLSSLGKTAGLAGIALGVFLLLFRGVLEKEFLPKAGLEPSQAFAIILSLMILTFGIAGLGMIAWLISRTAAPRTPIPGSTLNILAALMVVVLGAAVYVAAKGDGAKGAGGKAEANCGGIAVGGNVTESDLKAGDCKK